MGDIKPFSEGETTVGFFDSLMRSSFTEIGGQHVFYPHGLLSRGVILHDEELRGRARRFVRAYYQVGLFLILFSLIFGWGIAALALPFVLLCYTVMASRLTRGLQPAPQGITLADRLRLQASRHSRSDLWTLTIGSSVFVVAGLYILIAVPERWLIACVTIVFFGAGTVAAGSMIRIRPEVRKGN